jgi:hypothetical protein
MSGRFINWEYTANGFFKWLIQAAGKPYDEAVLTACIILLSGCFYIF